MSFSHLRINGRTMITLREALVFWSRIHANFSNLLTKTERSRTILDTSELVYFSPSFKTISHRLHNYIVLEIVILRLHQRSMFLYYLSSRLRIWLNLFMALTPIKVHVLMLYLLYSLNKHGSITVPLSIIFNSSIESNCFPDAWKDAHAVPVFKSGTKSMAENYRGI